MALNNVAKLTLSCCLQTEKTIINFKCFDIPIRWNFNILTNNSQIWNSSLFWHNKFEQNFLLCEFEIFISLWHWLFYYYSCALRKINSILKPSEQSIYKLGWKHTICHQMSFAYIFGVARSACVESFDIILKTQNQSFTNNWMWHIDCRKVFI